jgi:hypothetical protein
MPDNTAMSGADAATVSARADILAAIDSTGPGAVGHGTIRLREPSDPPAAAVQQAASQPASGAAPAAPQGAGHGTIRLRG